MFLEDVRLMVGNAERYNGPTHPVAEIARNILAEAERLLVECGLMTQQVDTTAVPMDVEVEDENAPETDEQPLSFSFKLSDMTDPDPMDVEPENGTGLDVDH
jgi:hypothetical protein